MTFTHLDRLMFPAAHITKGDILKYYAQVAKKLIPHLRNRAITLERLPEGLSAGEKSPHFWQKNTPTYYPDWIPRVRLPTESGRPVDYALVNDEQSLLYLVNQGAITFHPFLSRVGSLDTPDFVLFDIDPHQSTFANAVKVARQLREELKSEKVPAYIKTTGKTGLHVLTPWHKKAGGYPEARAWAATIAQRVADTLPKIATTERNIKARGSRVYLDVMQNAQGKHAVPPYVLRPTEQATISMPLDWTELTPRLNPKKFTIPASLKRLKTRKDLFANLTQ